MGESRARSTIEKQARARQILGAAAAALDELGYPSVRMTEVARRAGVAKGTPYRYFESKEALYLELLLAELQDWIDGLMPRLAGADESEAVAAVLAADIASRSRMLELLGVLASVLEHNVPTTTIIAFKTRLLAGLEPLARGLESNLEQLAEGDGLVLLKRLNALVVGLAPMASPSPAAAAAIANPPLDLFQIDLRCELEATIAALLRGWIALTLVESPKR